MTSELTLSIETSKRWWLVPALHIIIAANRLRLLSCERAASLLIGLINRGLVVIVR